MKILVACEYSARVRDAFIAAGHLAVSCDLLPTQSFTHHDFVKNDGSIHKLLVHYQGDIFECIDFYNKLGLFFDLIIAHPPCTFLTCAAEWAYGHGPYHQKVKPGTLTGEGRKIARAEAIEFVKKIMALPIKRKCLENPVGVLARHIGKPTQIIQPYWFGDDASKATCLWLDGLPPLIPTAMTEGREVEYPKRSGKIVKRWSNQTDSGQNKLSPGEDRWKERSTTYQGIANAMASQWGSLNIN